MTYFEADENIKNHLIRSNFLDEKIIIFYNVLFPQVPPVETALKFKLVCSLGKKKNISNS